MSKLPHVVAVNRLMQLKVSVARRAASTESTVLLLGESGVGKRLFAQFIHFESARRDGPFEEVNCAAVPSQILERELFEGFARADGGTILLQSIEALPIELQSKLLGVLQSGRVYLPKTKTARNIDTRVIGATARDIESLVERNGFRPDLFYRLNVLPMYLPPLRERTDDIEKLALYFLKQSCDSSGRGKLKLTADSVHALVAHRWPGNVLELKAVMQRASLTADVSVQVGDLSLRTILPEGSIDTYHGETLKDAVRAYKRRFIQGALDSNGWNQTATSRALEIQRTYLSRLIKELEISNK